MNVLDLLAQVLTKIPLSYLDTDATLAANSDQRIASQKATKGYVDALGTQNAWTAYTPTITVGSGALTTYTATGRYLLVGKTLHLAVQIAITNNGTAAGNLSFSLPGTLAAQASQKQVIGGRETQSTGVALTGTTNTTGASNVAVQTYNNAYPGGTNYTLCVTGVIEVN